MANNLEQDRHSVLFVDDEPNILNALRRALRRYRDRWEMTFVEGGKVALDVLRTRSFDIVVSDMRMPDLDGAALLSEVERLHPGSVRVILSGFSDEKGIMRAAAGTHAFLAKPCDPDRIIALMDRSMALRRYLGSGAIRDLVTGIDRLPSPPARYQRLMAEFRRDSATIDDIARIIGEDMAMSAAVLKMANSAYFSLPNRVGDIFLAVRFLGFEKVRTLTITASLFSCFRGRAELASLVSRVNMVAMARAVLTEKLIREDGGSAELRSRGFSAGMMSPIGKLIFLTLYPEIYPNLLESAVGGGLPKLERDALGATNEELAAYLLGLWGLEDEVVEAVLYQRTPADCSYQGPGLLPYVHLAQVLGPQVASLEQDLDLDYLEGLGMGVKARMWRDRSSLSKKVSSDV
ncbi:MAG: HDOD domain-containing protein [Rhodospirillum sp.]|nr:HDOD domain-containing protein [Rhodospirillum sp.]MCF8488603.1 HDOD domain-containing protein [Rhodospirillum sp.]MCF8499693.1 HDOD domain-containing protein [Rhodospirillum sp.]